LPVQKNVPRTPRSRHHKRAKHKHAKHKRSKHKHVNHKRSKRHHHR